MKVERMKMIYRKNLRENRHKAFLFGDNMASCGKKGQAYEMRGEWNAFGIPTKWAPGTSYTDYFYDGDFQEITQYLDIRFKELYNSNFQIVVIPEAGIGTGLARLDQTAPRIFAYLQEKLKEIEIW